MGRPPPAAANPAPPGHGRRAAGVSAGPGLAPASSALGGSDVADRDPDELGPLGESCERLSDRHLRGSRLWRCACDPDPPQLESDRHPPLTNTQSPAYRSAPPIWRPTSAAWAELP